MVWVWLAYCSKQQRGRLEGTPKWHFTCCNNRCPRAVWQLVHMLRCTVSSSSKMRMGHPVEAVRAAGTPDHPPHTQAGISRPRPGAGRESTRGEVHFVLHKAPGGPCLVAYKLHSPYRLMCASVAAGQLSCGLVQPAEHVCAAAAHDAHATMQPCDSSRISFNPSSSLHSAKHSTCS